MTTNEEYTLIRPEVRKLEDYLKTLTRPHYDASRRGILYALLACGGKVTDPGGSATAKLKKKMTEGQDRQSLGPIFKELEDAGYIRRKINGKRCTEISLVGYDQDRHDPKYRPKRAPRLVVPPEHKIVVEDPQPAPDVSYSELALELLVQVSSILEGGKGVATPEEMTELSQLRADFAAVRSELEKTKTDLDHTKNVLASRTQEIENKKAEIRVLQERNRKIQANLDAALQRDVTEPDDRFRAVKKIMEERPRGGK